MFAPGLAPPSALFSAADFLAFSRLALAALMRSRRASTAGLRLPLPQSHDWIVERTLIGPRASGGTGRLSMVA